MKNYLLRTLGLGKLNTSSNSSSSTPNKSLSLNTPGDSTPTGFDHFNFDRRDEEEYKRYEEIWAQPYTYLLDIAFESEELLKSWNLFVQENLSRESSKDSALSSFEKTTNSAFESFITQLKEKYNDWFPPQNVLELAVVTTQSNSRARSKAVTANNGLFSSVGVSSDVLGSLQSGSFSDISYSHDSTIQIQGFKGAIGHPIDVLSTVCSHFKHQVQTILKDFNLDKSNNLSIRSLYLLDIIEILTRSHHNRLFMREFNVLPFVSNILKTALCKLQLIIADKRFSDREISTLSIESAIEVENELRQCLDFVIYILSNGIQIFSHFCESVSYNTATNVPTNTTNTNNSDVPTPLSITRSSSINGGEPGKNNIWYQNNKNFRRQKMLTYITSREDIDFMDIIIEMLTTFRDSISKQYDGHHHSPKYYETWSFLFNFQEASLQMVRAIITTDKLKAISQLAEHQFRDIFLSRGGCDILVKYLGWPIEHVSILHDTEWFKIDILSLNAERLNYYFQTQLLTMKIITRLIESNYSYLRLFGKQGFNKIRETGLWISFFCTLSSDYESQAQTLRNNPLPQMGSIVRSRSGSLDLGNFRFPPTPISNSGSINVKRFPCPGFISKTANERAMHFFDCLRKLVKLSTIISFPKTLHSSTSTPGTPSSMPTFDNTYSSYSSVLHNTDQDITIQKNLSKLLFSFFLDNEGDKESITEKALQKLRLLSDFPFYFIDSINRLVSESQTALDVMVSNELYDVLFSKYFYFYGGSFNPINKIEEKRMANNSNPVKDENEGNELLMRSDICAYIECASAVLRSSVIDFMKYTSTIKGRNNVEECRKLIDILELYNENSFVASEIGLCLLDILRQNFDITQESLYSLKAMSVLSRVISKQHTLVMSLDMERPKSQFYHNEYTEDHVRAIEARNIILNVLDFALTHEKSLTLALQSHNTIEMMFKIILDPTLKNFVLVHVRQLLNAKNIEHSHEFEVLLTCFTEVFPVIMDNPTQPNLQLLMEMLAAVQKGLCGSNKKLLQTQFRDKLDKFMHLLNLNIPSNPSEADCISRHVLAIEVIRTLTALISDNSKSKQHFKTILGYDTFKNFILHCEQNKPSPDIFDVLFDMLSDGEFNSETNYTIQNPDVARLIFQLALNCDISYVAELVAKFSLLVEKSTNNRNICCSVGLISTLLELLTRFEKEANPEDKTIRDIVTLIETIGRHSITVKELKGFLTLIKQQSDRDHTTFLSILLKALANMTQSSPDAFFDFNGLASGLVLPVIDNRIWPNAKGYSISMWVRVESFVETRPASNANPSTFSPVSTRSFSFVTDSANLRKDLQMDTAAYKPRLASFFNSEGQGFEIYFENNYLKVSVQHSQKKQYTEVFDFKFDPKRWYHIMLTHSYGKGPFSFSKNELKLYVDGNSPCKVLFKYPTFHKPLDKCMIGSSFLVNENLQLGTFHKRQNSFQASENPNFNGQMGTLCVFDESLPPNIIQLIYGLGYNYMNCFQPTDSVLAKNNSKASQEYLQLFDGSITQKIILCYSPKSRANLNKICVNNTPEAFHQLQLYNGLASLGESVPQIKTDIHQSMLNARILNGTQLCVTHNAKDIIGCLGGIKVLFPLFLQLDRLSHSDQVVSVNDRSEPYMVNTLFSLLIDLLSEHVDNLEDMARCRGFLVISFLLKQISPQHLTRSTIALIPTLLSCVQRHSLLYSDTINYLVFNFRLWIYTDAEVQKILFQQLLDLNNKKENFTKVREILGVQRLLDLMRWFYWFERSKNMDYEYQLGTEKICNPVTSAVLGQRPNIDDIREIRQKLILLLKGLTAKSSEIVVIGSDDKTMMGTPNIPMTTTSITYSELEAIVNYLADCSDSLQYDDIIEFVLELLLSPDGNAIAEMLYTMKAYQVFVQLLYIMKESTRLNVLKCIGQMLVLNSKMRQKMCADETFGFVAIYNALSVFNFTIQTYGVLRDIFLGNISKGKTKDILDQDDFEQTEYSYRVHSVIQPIFRLLVNTQPNVKHHILQNWKIQMKSNKAKDCVLHQVGWQEWLLNILCVSRLVDAAQPYDATQSAQFELCKDIVIELIAILLYHSLKTVKKGWRDIEDTIGHIILLKDRDQHLEGAEEILGSIYKRILDEYINDIQNDKIIANYNDRNSPILDNFVHLATFIEEYLFYFDSTYQSVSGSWLRKRVDANQTVLGTIRSIVTNTNTQTPTKSQDTVSTSSIMMREAALDPEIIYIDTSTVPSTPTYDTPITVSTPESTKRVDLNTSTSSTATTTTNHQITYYTEDEINLRKGEDGIWRDLPIAEKLIYILTQWKLNIVSNYTSLRTVVQGGKRLRDGGTLRITLRLIRYCLRESQKPDPSLLDCIKRINQRDVESEKEILRFSELWAVTGDIENNDDFHTRLMCILAFLFDTMSRLVEKKRDDEALGIFITIREIFMTRKDHLEQALTTDDDKSILADDSVFSSKKQAVLSDFQVFHSKSWKLAWARFFVPAVRQTEKEEARFLEDIISRRKYTIQKLYDTVKDHETASAEFEKKLDSEMKVTLDNIRRQEKERIKKEKRGYEEFDFLASHYWKKTMRNVADERSIWGKQTDSVKWKLDKSITGKHIRLRLVRDFSGIDHKDASMKKSDQLAPSAQETSINKLLEIKEKGSFFIPNLSVITNQTSEDSTEDSNEVTSINANSQTIQPQQPFESEDQLNQKHVEKEKTIMKDIYCEMITPMIPFSGKMEITNKRIIWTADKENQCLTFGWSERVAKLVKTPREKTIYLEDLVEIRLMRYRLRKSSLEFYLNDESTVMFNFDKNERNKIYTKIISLKCPNLRSVEKSFSPIDNLQRAGWTKKWQQGKISNFEYLMILNMYAGRTINDLSQYPVFPWVIADYSSPTLDFTKESTFRDLSKPMGVVNPDKVKNVEEKYITLSDSGEPPYHYGSHYSTSAYVTYYLIRLEPYTTLARVVQGGKFDHADRMFESVAQTYDHCLHGEGDHKELIPEFFYLPEFLKKPNDLTLGEKQSGDQIGDVILPPWAKNAEDFIRINREALESDYVSQHLHEWIDLIFGYKQRGPEAVKAHNMFHYLTYEGTIDLDQLDERDKYPVLARIDNFGQTPSQLFKVSHPKKTNKRDSKYDTLLALSFQGSRQVNTVKISPIVFIKFYQTENTIVRVCVVTEDGLVYTTKAGNVNLQAIINDLAFLSNCKTIGFPLDDPVSLLSSNTTDSSTNSYMSSNPTHSTKQRRSLASLPKQGLGYKSNASNVKNYFSIPNTPIPNSIKDISIFSCGHFDNSFRISKPYSQPLHTKISTCQQNAIWRHKDLVTCCAICEEDKYFVTGSRDTTVMVWNIQNDSFLVTQQPTNILYGHDDEVTCVAVCNDLDTVISGSKDGTVIVHSLRRGKYIRTIKHPNNGVINTIGIARECKYSNDIEVLGRICVYSNDDMILYLYSLNGNLIAKAETNGALNCMRIFDCKYVIYGGDHSIVVRDLHSLKVIHKIDLRDQMSSVRSIEISNDEQMLFAGLDSGKLLIYGIENQNTNGGTTLNTNLSQPPSPRHN